MKILITGATGFIGSHLAERLHAKGYALRCLVRRSSNLVWLKDLPVEYVYGDLFDLDALKKAVEGADYIYHLAGVTKARTKEEYVRGNHTGTKNILDAAVEHGRAIKRFIHVSSQTVVGPSRNWIPVDERSEFHPITTYGISKMEAEKECLKLSGRLPITIVRAPAVYGPRDKDVFAFFESMNKGLQPMIGFNNKEVSLVHVKDLVDGMVLAGEHPKAVGQTYFISSERFYNWREVGELTARIMGKKVLRLRVPEFLVYVIAVFSEIGGFLMRKPVLLNLEKARDIVQNAWTCSIKKAKDELGYSESLGLEEGIKNTVDWYRREGWLR